MYRVVLVDDENLIVQGLQKVIPWEKYNCIVAGTASSAEEGIETIRRVKADILITDIRMPDDSGLNMLAGLRSEFEDMEVTVLTGYRDFAYAQEAIRLGVRRFLLKPSRMEEIDEALTAMVNHLNKRNDMNPAANGENENRQISSNYIVRQALGYMKEHFSEKLNLQTVANQCYVSQWHLSKLLNKELHQSFYEILNEIRVQEAIRLLENPNLKIGEIVERVGYTDSAHFARVFKKQTGVSAIEYRNHQK